MSQTGIITKSRSKLRNRLKGLTPTITTNTGTDPTNLENITDENPETKTGTGLRTSSGGEAFLVLNYDLGVNCWFILAGSVNLKSSAGTITIYAGASTTSPVSIQNNNTILTFTSTSTKTTPFDSNIYYGRYLKIQFSIGGGADIEYEINEIRALEI